MKKWVLILSFVIPYFVVFSQDTIRKVQWDDVILRLQYHNGEISQKYIFNPTDRSQYIECNVVWQTNGSKLWHHYYRFPEMGFGLVYANYGNDSIFGQSIALYPHWMYHIINKKRFNLDFRIACGFAYFFNPFNRKTNPNNLLIGSSITNYTSFGLLLRYKSTKHIDVYAGANIFHYSAAHTQIPNLGLNDMPLTVGLSYKLGNTNIDRTFTPDTSARKWHFNARLAYGTHKFAESVHPAKGPSYPIYNLSMFASKQLGNVSDFHIGIVGTYYASYYDIIRLEEWFPGKERLNSYVLSGMLAHEFLISHFGFLIEADIHFYNPFYKKRYENNLNGFNSVVIKSFLGGKVGFIYYPLKKANTQHNNLGIGLFLKTHLGQADFAELSLSYSL